MCFLCECENEPGYKNLEHILHTLTKEEKEKLARKIRKDIEDAYQWHMLKEDRRNGKI